MIDTSNKEIRSHYDFIVVGAGAAGSVLAAELSATGTQVLVVESGGPDEAPTSIDYVPAAAIPVPALTAWQALFTMAHLSAGRNF